jgi:hypothetical protein
MIEIRQPELEALIMERMQSGAFQNVEEVLYQALTQSPAPVGPTRSSFTTADILAAFNRSPFKEVNLEPESEVSTISPPVQF